MTLEKLYRDIYSRLGLEGDNHPIYQDDIIKAINDAVRQLRIEYVRGGMASYFAETETLTSFTEDTNYSFLVSDTLAKSLLDEAPEHLTIIASTSFITSDELTDTVQSFSSGDVVYKGNDLYEAVDDVSSINSYDLTFDPRTVRPYSENNGLVYKTGEIVYERSTGDYSKVTSDFTAENDTENLEKVYWRLIGKANTYTSHYPFSGLRNLRIFESIEDPQAFTVKDKTVYATPSIKKLVLSYVPKWTDVETFSTDVDIPDFMIGQVKAQALQQLAQKLGTAIEINQPELTQEENE